MPARTGQPLEHRSLGGLFVEMHRLRVEFGGKGQNFLARDAAWSEPAEMAGREIFECQRGHDGEMPEGSPIVAVISSNLNPAVCMACALPASITRRCRLRTCPEPLSGLGQRPDWPRLNLRSAGGTTD